MRERGWTRWEQQLQLRKLQVTHSLYFFLCNSKMSMMIITLYHLCRSVGLSVVARTTPLYASRKQSKNKNKNNTSIEMSIEMDDADATVEAAA